MFQKTRSIVAKYGRQVAVGSVVMVGTSQAFADAAAASASITAAGSDVSTIGWASLGLLIVAAAFKYMRRTV
jgi:hypothetical protein